MASKDLVYKQYTDAFNEVHDLLVADRLDECEAAAFRLLAESTMPRYHRMKTLILLGTIVGDWEEANRYHVAAECMWRIVRRFHPEGKDKDVEKQIKELREALDDLDLALRDDEPSEYDFINAVEDVIEEHDAEVEDACVEMDDMDLDDDDDEELEDAPAVPSIKVEAPLDTPPSPAKAPVDTPSSPAKAPLRTPTSPAKATVNTQLSPVKKTKNPKRLMLCTDHMRDPSRQPAPDSPAMLSSNWRAASAPRSPAFASTNWRQRQRREE